MTNKQGHPSKLPPHTRNLKFTMRKIQLDT